jgi:hypothetical protein
MRSLRDAALGAGLPIMLAGGLTLAWIASAQQSAAPSNPAAMFRRIASVLQSPRCLNCHTVTDFPRQGDDRHAHIFFVSRGPDDRGVPMARCASCHGEANNDATGIPGRPDWHMAPLSMGWEGLSPAQLCHRLLDPAANGHRSPEQIYEHIAFDRQFVAWAWSPGHNIQGVERSVPPIPHDEFAQLVKQWVAAGAPCPQ